MIGSNGGKLSPATDAHVNSNDVIFNTLINAHRSYKQDVYNCNDNEIYYTHDNIYDILVSFCVRIKFVWIMMSVHC